MLKAIQDMIGEIEFACDTVQIEFDNVIDNDGYADDRARLDEAVQEIIRLKDRLYKAYDD